MNQILALHEQAFKATELISRLEEGELKERLKVKEDELWTRIAKLELEFLYHNKKGCPLGFKEVCDQETKGSICLSCYRREVLGQPPTAKASGLVKKGGTNSSHPFKGGLPWCDSVKAGGRHFLVTPFGCLGGFSGSSSPGFAILLRLFPGNFPHHLPTKIRCGAGRCRLPLDHDKRGNYQPAPRI